MSKKKKSLIAIVAVIIAAVIVVMVLFNRNKFHFQSPIVFLPDSQHVINSDKATPVQNDAELLTGQPYSDKVMQFDENCRAAPVTMVAAVGDAIMFDNRSAYQRTLTVGQQSYTVGPFGQVTLSFGTIDNYPVSCDSFRRVGIVGIQ